MRSVLGKTKILAAVAAAGLVAAACGSSGPSSVGTSPTTQATGGVKGGVLKIVGNGDVDYLDTAAGYYASTYTVERAYTRQLYSYAASNNLASEINPVPDLATAMPTVTNGGKTYTIHIRQGAMWDTSPPRQVTAADEVLGMKRLCNPAAPVGAPQYYTDTIVGMNAYCNGFAHVDPKSPAAMKAYITGHDVSGVKALDQTTVQFNLLEPAPDFLNILAMQFSSPAPAEYLNYIPAGTDATTGEAMHTISDGPYAITSYVPNKSVVLKRNSAWSASTDPIRKAWVDEIDVTEGVATATAAVQQVQAGAADNLWDQVVPTALLAGMQASHDPQLFIGPLGDNFVALNPQLRINFLSPNNNGALQKLQVRQALEYAIDKVVVSQIYGGSAVSKPLDQFAPPGNVGYVSGYNPYPTPGDRGDPAKAKALLQAAGYAPGQITLKLPFRPNSVHPQVAQADQASLQAAGFNVQLIPVTPSDFYTKYLENPTASKAGAWDVAEAGWNPDWLGLNGRANAVPLLDGRGYGPASSDFGDYNSPVLNSIIDKALAASSQAQATTYWEDAAKQIMADAAIVPIGEQKTATYVSSRTKNCLYLFQSSECDVTNEWLKG